MARLCVMTVAASALPSLRYKAVLPRRSANRMALSRVVSMALERRGVDLGADSGGIMRPVNEKPGLRAGSRRGKTAGRAPLTRQPCALSKIVKVGPELVRTRRVLEFADGLGLDLADALAGDVELLADLFQRVVGRHLDAEAHAQHLGLEI